MLYSAETGALTLTDQVSTSNSTQGKEEVGCADDPVQRVRALWIVDRTAGSVLCAFPFATFANTIKSYKNLFRTVLFSPDCSGLVNCLAVEFSLHMVHTIIHPVCYIVP